MRPTLRSTPRLGPDGNYRAYDQLPYKLFSNEWAIYFVGPMYSHGDPIAPWVNVPQEIGFNDSAVCRSRSWASSSSFVICAGIRAVFKKDSNGSHGSVDRLLRRLRGVARDRLAGRAVVVYCPTRFFMYSLPFLITLIFPWSLYILLGRVPRLHSSAKLKALTFLGILSVFLMAFGGRGNVEFAASLEQQLSQPLADAITALPKDILIAGWPAAEIRNVEYVTRRNVFLTAATHQVLHLTYMKAMRVRMDALFVKAYLSTDAAPLYRLKQEFGVTHLLVETRDFTDPKRPPEYFAPWRARIGPRLAEIKGKEYLMNRSLQEKAAVYNQNGFILLDLAKLP